MPEQITAALCLLAVLLAAFTLTTPSGSLLYTLPPPLWILLFTLALLKAARLPAAEPQSVRLASPFPARPSAPRPPPPFVR
ncbi:MAG: hypothetical protein FJW31_15320 [Acidobacteria bacterium]|nr:hypothetical protein [Acidobacteriota bacterium]